MNEFVVVNLILRRIVPAVAAGLDRTFRLVGAVKLGAPPTKHDLMGAGGVPATRSVEIRETQATKSSSTQLVKMESEARAGTTTSLTAPTPSSPAAADDSADVVKSWSYVLFEHQGEANERQEDDLDWAGSLAHAAASSAHIGNILAMIRAGWLIPDAEQLAGVSLVLDAMDAFHARTDTAIAPILAAMDEDQLVDFFDDFGADLPPDLPELDGV